MAIFESPNLLALGADFSTVCRLCLENNPSNFDIFGESEHKFEISLQSILWRLFCFWVRPEDGLPKLICPNCLHKVHTFHSFASKVKETQNQIHEIVLNKGIPPQKAFHITRNLDNSEEKDKFEEVNNGHSFEASELNPEPFETYSETNVPQVDPWQFLNEEATSLVPVRANTNSCPPFSTTLEKIVYVKVENGPQLVDPFICQSPSEPKNVNVEEQINARKTRLMRTRKIQIKRNQNKPKPVPKVKLKPLKTEALKEEIVYEEEICDDNEDDRNISTSDSDSDVSESSEPVKQLRVKSLVDRKKNWTERSKQRSALTEQLAKFYNFKCLECLEETKFPTYHQLNLHCKNSHNLKGYVFCCNQKLQDKNVIKSHMLKHLSPGIFQCQECGKELANKESLENHLVKHLPEEKRPFKCNECGRGFPSKGGLTAHEKCHLPDDERMRYVCDVCGKRFPYQTSLNSHKKYVHLNLRTVMCHICPKTFVDKASLNSHIHTHLTNERVQCQECGKWFKNQINLRAHMKTHEGLIFTCPKCTKVFSTKHRLGEHVRGHTDARPHPCSICSKSFKVRAGLKTHMVQHTGEKPYQCQYCNRTFASSGNFSTHKKRMHGSLKSELNEYINITQPNDLLENDIQVGQQLGLIHSHNGL